MILESYETSNIKASISPSLQIGLEEIKNNAQDDAMAIVKSTPAYVTSTGPFQKQVNENEVYFTTHKLYDGDKDFQRVIIFQILF